jgi:hypothetical protein
MQLTATITITANQTIDACMFEESYGFAQNLVQKDTPNKTK